MTQKFNIHTGQINAICLYNNNQNIAVGGYDGVLSLWEIKKKVFGPSSGSHSPVGEAKKEIVCLKIISNNYYIYSLISIGDDFSPYIILADAENKCKIFDPEKMIIINESEVFLPTDPIVDNLQFDVTAENGNFSFLMCFTKNQMFILDDMRLDPVQLFDNNILFNNNVGITLNNCNKAIFLAPKANEFSNKGTNQNNYLNAGIYVVMVDQSPKTNRLISLFKLSLV